MAVECIYFCFETFPISFDANTKTFEEKLCSIHSYSLRKWTQQPKIVDEAVRISHCANTLGKGMNSTNLPPAIT